MSAAAALMAASYAIDGDPTQLASYLRICGASTADCNRLIDKLRQAQDMRESLLEDVRADAYYAGYSEGRSDGMEDALGRDA